MTYWFVPIADIRLSALILLVKEEIKGLAEAKPHQILLIEETRTATYLGGLLAKRIMKLSTTNGDKTKKNGKASVIVDTIAPP
jgi:hypothetical protein